MTVSGTGAFLFWNKADGTLTAANSDISSDNIYYVCMLKYREFDPEVKFTAISCAYPAFTFDLLTNKLYINFRYYGYIVYDGQTIEIPQNHTQEINIDNHCMIVYNVDSRQFEKIAYSAIQYDRGKYIPICVRNYNDIIGNFNYELVPYAKCYKKCYCYGDSLTWYDGHEFTWGDHQGEMCVGFESYLRAYLRMSVTNVGVSGETTPEICARLASDSGPRTANYITIMGGDNDDRLQITPGNVLPAGSTFDTTTVAGALQNAIETVQAANPDARIILMTEPIGWTYRNGDMERVDDEYPKTYRKVAEMYGLPLIDLWNESGINEMNREDYMIDPTVSDGNTSYIYHPSNKAWERIGKLICKVLEKY